MKQPKTSDEVAIESAEAAADDDMPAEIDFSQARRGAFLPRDPVERAARLEARVIALQKSGAALRQETVRLRTLLAWEAGQLSEQQAAALLGVSRRTLREYRASALAETVTDSA